MQYYDNIEEFLLQLQQQYQIYDKAYCSLC